MAILKRGISSIEELPTIMQTFTKSEQRSAGDSETTIQKAAAAASVLKCTADEPIGAGARKPVPSRRRTEASPCTQKGAGKPDPDITYGDSKATKIGCNSSQRHWQKHKLHSCLHSGRLQVRRGSSQRSGPPAAEQSGLTWRRTSGSA